MNKIIAICCAIPIIVGLFLSVNCGVSRGVRLSSGKSLEWLVKPKFDRAWGFKNGVAIVFEEGGNRRTDEDDLCGYVFPDGRVISPEFDHCGKFHKGIATVHAGGKYEVIKSNRKGGSSFSGKTESKKGIIDEKGSYLVRPKYNSLNGFNDGLAAAGQRDKNYRYRYGYINMKGNWEIEPKYDQADSFYKGRACVKIGTRWGIIDRSGVFVVDPIFQELSYLSGELSAAKIDGQWGYIDKQGRFIIKPSFQNAKAFVGDFAFIMLNDTWGVIDKTGKIILEPRYGAIRELKEGICMATMSKPKRYDKGTAALWFFIDRRGNRLSREEFDRLPSYQEGLSLLCTRGGCGFYNIDGKMVFRTNPAWRDVRGFKNGYARVQIGSIYDRPMASMRDSTVRMGLIDTKGTVVVKPVYRSVHDFSEGFAVVQQIEGENRYVYGYVDQKGKVAIPLKFSRADDFSEGLAFACVNVGGAVKCGYIGKDGKFVIEPQFDEIGNAWESTVAFANGVAGVRINGKWGFIRNPLR